MVDGDGWICLNDGEKKIVQRMRLKTEKKGGSDHKGPFRALYECCLPQWKTWRATLGKKG